MVYGTQPRLANRNWFFSTLDSELAGYVKPGQLAEGGFKQVRPQSGGNRRKSRTNKSKKARKGKKPKRTVRKSKRGKKVMKTKTRRSRR
jgi:hypothetical protein